MEKAKLYLHTKYQVGSVDERIFGGFLEHLGRAVYEGVYDPTSPHADEDGFRKDVMNALKEMRYTAMRYPGGNFASDYHFENGIGEKRESIIDYAWQSIEDNSFGTDEFMRLCKKMGWQSMLTVNLGTGTPEEARNWVEYCNAPVGTKYSNMRAKNGHPEPYNVKLWCLGNEMDGIWQLGHVPAREYAIRAQQAAKMMKDVDPSIELIAAGSSGFAAGPTYMTWDDEVLSYIGDFADYISLHCYVGNYENNSKNYFYKAKNFDVQIQDMASVCRFVQAKSRSKKRIQLSFDEWNVWYRANELEKVRIKAPHLLEEVYNQEDALICAAYLLSFIRNADCLKIANIAQIVNVIAPILTDGDKMLIQSIYYPFVMMSKRREGISLKTVTESPMIKVDDVNEMQSIDSGAILNGNELSIFLTNYSDKDLCVCVDLADKKIKSVQSCEILVANDLKDANTYENQEIVKTKDYAEYLLENEFMITLPAYSFVAATLNIE